MTDIFNQATTINAPSFSSPNHPTNKRPCQRESPQNRSYADATATTILHPSPAEMYCWLMKQVDVLNNQLAEKDLQIRALNETIRKLQDRSTIMQYPTMEEEYIPNVNAAVTGEDTFSKCIVVTNIVEQTEDSNADESDKTAVIDLIKEIDPSATVESIKRMGRRDTTKNRPIQVTLATKADKRNVLSKAPAIIKAKPNLVSNKTFINNMLSPEAHRIQMKLKKKVNQLRQHYKDQDQEFVKVFIKQNQIYLRDTRHESNPPQKYQDPVNTEAERYYSFRGQRQRTTSDATFMDCQ